MTTLNVDGPHSPEYTREVGNTLAECMRVLNYATRGDGLHNPGDAYLLLGNLKEAVGRLPQLLRQTSEFLERGIEEGSTHRDRDGDPAPFVNRATEQLTDALTYAEDLYDACDRAQQAIQSLTGRE